MSDSIQFDHIAVGVHRLSDASGLFAGRLGGRPFEGGPGPGYRGAQWEFASGARLEAIEPMGPRDGFLHRFLAARGPGIHHVTFIVPSLRAAVARAASLGYAVVGYQDTHPSWKEAFLHPREAHGIVVQMAEKGPPSEGEWSSAFDFPYVPSAPSVSARIVGLRLSFRDVDAARRQWVALLEGREETRDGFSVFTWQGSPMRLTVAESPTEEEGPLGIEVAGIAGDVEVHPETGVRLLGAEAVPR